MSPVFSESNLLRHSLLNWGIFAVVLAAGIGVAIYGMLFSGSNSVNLEKTLTDKDDAFDAHLMEQWDKVDPYLEDCSEMGYLLRQIEARTEYSIRLFLLLKRSAGKGYILINDGGVCWIDGEKEKMELRDKDWFERYFNTGVPPIAPPESPFSNIGGLWSYTPVMDGIHVWGILLIQHYEY